MHHPSARVEQHAKIFNNEGRQVLAYLYRDGDDAMCAALQVWVEGSDAQLRAVIQTEDDEDVLLWFAQLDETTLKAALTGVGLIETLDRFEESLS